MKYKATTYNTILSLGLFLLSFFIAWHASASMNFLYAFWYDALEIDQTIKTYAPKNKNKNGFEQTHKYEHIRVFSEIVRSIQNNGDGLDQIMFESPDGKIKETLLTANEVIHLKDVAYLVSNLTYLLLIALVLVFLSLFLMISNQIKIANIKSHILGTLGLIILLVVFILLVGPTKIFYFGHELIFPNNNQWFFYYEDSLMSTMMKAPDLFGPIALELLLTTVLIWFAMIFAIKQISEKYLLGS